MNFYFSKDVETIIRSKIFLYRHEKVNDKIVLKISIKIAERFLSK